MRYGGIRQADLGALDRVPPATIAAESVSVAAFVDSVQLQWPPSPDDANGVGTWHYVIYRDGEYYAETTTPSFTDEAVY